MAIAIITELTVVMEQLAIYLRSMVTSYVHLMRNLLTGTLFTLMESHQVFDCYQVVDRAQRYVGGTISYSLTTVSSLYIGTGQQKKIVGRFKTQRNTLLRE